MSSSAALGRSAALRRSMERMRARVGCEKCAGRAATEPFLILSASPSTLNAVKAGRSAASS